jgi:hypothetical protein
MQTPATYIVRTESAVRKLFEGITSYTDLLFPICGATYVSGETDVTKFQAEFNAWKTKNAVALAASQYAQREHTQEAFAMATLCGAVLQVAAKAIECYSSNKIIPAKVQSVVAGSTSAIPYAIGRELCGVPIGLIIYAGRNQHMHFNDAKLNRVNVAVFEQLAAMPKEVGLKNPAFALENSLLDRSGSGCLNNFPRFISGFRAGWEVQSCPRRRASLATNDRRGGQLGAHQEIHLTRPASTSARLPRTFPAA